ncbi:Uncharacterized protein FWK35_00028247 [Aphis craccivora]|uniref:RNase H domain-containing protein n=1 Tax=Aphis craccivora TaxID=307492 RepID=A0A6G0XQF4_APHCR|nr:Uncharacterized protein FWK35_00028247 [Aphis craccivora]
MDTSWRKEKPQCFSCGTELTVNHLITKCLQYADEHKNINIPNTFNATLRPDANTLTQILKFLNKTKQTIQ